MAGIDHDSVAKAIRREMAHLECAVWDLGPFMKGFHNWRKNIVFVECESLAVEELAQKLARCFKNAAFYTGAKKIRAREFASAPAEASIVIIARKDFTDTTEDKELGVRMPSMEERTMDLLAFALRKEIPVPVFEAANAISYALKMNAASISKMRRYSMKKYVDWLFRIIIYDLSKRGEIGGVDPRYIQIGKDYLAAIKEVGKRE